MRLSLLEENVGTIKSVVESLKNSIDEELATINNDNLIQIVVPIKTF